MDKIAPNLWFDSHAEEAVNFYVSVFKVSKIGRISRYPDVGQDIHGRTAGSVMNIEFTLNGRDFLALNGGPHFKFNEAVSLCVFCKDQAEIDYYWEKLSRGGDPAAQQCGWLKDKYGLSWQIAPETMAEMICDPDTRKTASYMNAMMKMKKLDIAALQKAYNAPSAKDAA